MSNVGSHESFPHGPDLLTLCCLWGSNVGQASFYSCGVPAMIKAWRELFKVPDLWFGFVQIANFRYSVPVSHSPLHHESVKGLPICCSRVQPLTVP